MASSARIDRRLLAGLGRDETYQMVRVPVSPAKWSTWKRYCGAAGISMGRAIVALIDRELASVVDDPGGDGFSGVGATSTRAAGSAARLRLRVGNGQWRSAEKRLRSRSEQLRRWEAELQTLAQRVELASKLAAQGRDDGPKVGRNDRCPCGSGLKYKHCHGFPARPPSVVSR